MSQQNVTYRVAHESDHMRIVDFQLAMALETENLVLERSVCEKGVLAVFNDSGLGIYHVCQLGGKTVGGALITTEWSDWRNGVVWWIHSVYLLPEARGRKIYSGLYAYIQSLAQADRRVRGLRLYVDRTNEPAQLVYAKLGMNGDHYRLFEWMKPASSPERQSN